jgi:hypothetical protein
MYPIGGVDFGRGMRPDGCSSCDKSTANDIQSKKYYNLFHQQL